MFNRKKLMVKDLMDDLTVGSRREEVIKDAIEYKPIYQMSPWMPTIAVSTGSAMMFDQQSLNNTYTLARQQLISNNHGLLGALGGVL